MGTQHQVFVFIPSLPCLQISSRIVTIDVSVFTALCYVHCVPIFIKILEITLMFL